MTVSNENVKVNFPHYKWEHLCNLNCTKGDLFKGLTETGKTFDYALPQAWLDYFHKKHNLDYHQVLYTTVWIYPEDKPVSCCTEVQEKIDLEFGGDV